jgi:hypothetical protein
MKLIQAESRIVVARAGGRENRSVLVNGYQASVYKINKIWVSTVQYKRIMNDTVLFS